MSSHWGRTLILAGSTIAWGACRADPPPPPPPPAVTVATVPERDVKEWDEFTGRLEAVDAVEIRPRVSGYIKAVTFPEGKEVRKGDVLFEIDPRPYQAELDRAEAELEQAKTGAELAAREVERAQTLVDVKAISREEFDGRTSAESKASPRCAARRPRCRRARLNLEWTQVRSPIGGRVSRAEVTAGNLVQAGPPTATLLTTVVSLDPIYVYFEGDEQTYLKYTAAGPRWARAASRDVRNPIYLGLANEDGLFPHRATSTSSTTSSIPRPAPSGRGPCFRNKDRLFTPGLFARLKLVGSGKYDATLVQDRAVGTDQDKKFVLVVKPDSTVDYRAGRARPAGRRASASSQSGVRARRGSGHQRAAAGTAGHEGRPDRSPRWSLDTPVAKRRLS